MSCQYLPNGTIHTPNMTSHAITAFVPQQLTLKGPMDPHRAFTWT